MITMSAAGSRRREQEKALNAYCAGTKLQGCVVVRVVQGGAAAELMAATNFHAPTHCTAVDQHDLGTIVEMVSQKTVDVNTETYSGDTALTMVAWWGERAVLKLLINAGASVSRETSYVGGVAAVSRRCGPHPCLNCQLAQAGSHCTE